MTVSRTPWHEDEDKIILTGLEAGHSRRRIALSLPGRSKNAVISRINRKLGKFPKHQSAPTPPANPIPAGDRRWRAGTAISRPSLTPTHTPQPQQPIMRPVCDEPVEPIGQGCGILELTDDTCRWPIGDPRQLDFFFCGGKSVMGLPYCGFHTRLAYEPTIDRQRETRLAERTPA